MVMVLQQGDIRKMVDIEHCAGLVADELNFVYPVLGCGDERECVGEEGGCGGQQQVLRCRLLTAVRAHQQPINLLQTRDNCLLTASQDHTIKVCLKRHLFLSSNIVVTLTFYF